MEYDFYKTFEGCREVKLSMGHEALANYINENIKNQQQCQIILTHAKTTQHNSVEKVIQQGMFCISFQSNEVHIQAIELYADSDFDHEDHTLELYDHEMNAECGLDDFILLLKAWYEFLG